MKSKHSSGFTLIELLVVISLIIVLAALVFALAGRAINSAQKAVCITNLQGVGTALQAYLTDKTGKLPGPLNTGQSALFNASSRSLLTYIAPYLEGEREMPAGGYLVDHYGCPSLMKRVKINTIAAAPVVYRLEEKGKLLDINGKDITYPWGYGVGTIPKNYDQIAPRSAGQVWVMIEQDQSMGGTWGNNGASEPAHGNQRMALYWDWSVKPVRLSQW